jgi:hypothetical protein
MLLHVAFIDLGGGGEAGAERVSGKQVLALAF